MEARQCRLNFKQRIKQAAQGMGIVEIPTHNNHGLSKLQVLFT